MTKQIIIGLEQERIVVPGRSLSNILRETNETIDAVRIVATCGGVAVAASEYFRTEDAALAAFGQRFAELFNGCYMTSDDVGEYVSDAVSDLATEQYVDHAIADVRGEIDGCD